MIRPLVLIIRDGWGTGPDTPGNAVMQANTPVMDRLLREHPVTMLGASGEAVGLRPGAQGSSEVGHLNMGAGRIVEQEVVRVDKAIRDGSLFASPLLTDIVRHCRESGSRLHLMGLVQDQGVHAVEDHLYSLLDHARSRGLRDVFVHFFADGRDTPPQSALTYLARLEGKMREFGVGRIASVMGRYYAMDRGRNWDRTRRAYDALVLGEGLRAPSARQAIEEAYARAAERKSGSADPENRDVPAETDEFIQPTLIVDENGRAPGTIREGDAVVHFNYRQDRAIQLTQAFVEPGFDAFQRHVVPGIRYAGLTRYYDEFRFALVPPMNMSNLLGEVLSKRGLWQLRIAEYQKYRHVTSFFNGKRIEPYPREDRVQVDSITIPENLKPEMSAYEVTEVCLSAIQRGIADMRGLVRQRDDATGQFHDEDGGEPARLRETYDVIMLNYANCDMVGHTGVIDAAVRAVETVDECVGRIVEAALAAGGTALVTSDHGNAEQMLSPDSGEPQTAHSTSDVEFVLVSTGSRSLKLRPRGVLSDIAPTMLQILDLPVPAEMSAESLIC